MNLLDVPVEIGILIFSYLDTKSKISAYGIFELRKFYAPCLLRKLDTSRSSLASMETLTLDIFQDFAANIQQLNLSGIADLTVDKLNHHIQRCANLKTLDITFTSIYLSDFPGLFCTEYLKNISINFFKSPTRNLRDGVWKNSLDVFKRQQFEYVHFVVFELFDSDSPLVFMKDVPRTKYLKITVANNYRDLLSDDDRMQIDEDEDEDPIDINFTKLFYIFRDCSVTKTYSNSLKGVYNLDYEQIEYIFIMYLYKERINIYVSPVFSRIFALNCTDLQIEICTRLPRKFLLDGNIIFKAWNKSTTDFNDVFFKSLLEELADYFPTYMCMHKMLEIKITEAPSNWYCIDSYEGFERVDNLPEKVTLTTYCRRNGTVQRERPIALVSGLELKPLTKITFLSLNSICLNERFFYTLFLQCKSLYTLDLDIATRGHSDTYDSSLSLSNSIHLTKSLKNIKLTAGDIEYEMTLAALCQCPTLENIYICEYERSEVDANHEIDVQNFLLLIEKCHDLYSLFIEAMISSQSLDVLIAPLRAAAQNLQRDHLRIQVFDGYDHRGWNPFADVFNPSPLDILD